MLEVVNYEEFSAELAVFQAELAAFEETAGDELRVVFEQGLMILQGEAADYPAQPSGSDYRRTGTLGRLWISAGRVIEGRGINLVGRVGNATPYARYVQGPGTQARWHQDVWATTEEIVKENRDAIDDLLARCGGRIVKRLLRPLGG
jgi:hypothetical protein